MTDSADLIEIRPKIRLSQSIELPSNDSFSILGFEINKLYVFILLAVALLLCMWLIYKWYFDKDENDEEDAEAESTESVSFVEQQEIQDIK